MSFDLAGHVTLSVRADDAELHRSIARQMSPYVSAADQAAEARVDLVARDGTAALTELQLAAGDGFVTGSDGERLYLISGDRTASVPDAFAEEPTEIRFDAGFPIGPLFRQIVRPSLQLAALRGGAVAVHAAGVVRGGQAVLVAGWSETGKTETALALAEEGAQFLTDKWTLVGQARAGEEGPTAAPFPIGVGIRRWLLPHAPRLRDAMPRRARLQFAAAASWGFVTRPIRSPGRRGAAGVLSANAERALALANRAALSPADLAEAYGHEPIRSRVPIGMVVVLRTVPGDQVSVREVPAAPVAERLAASSITERHGYYALRQRAAYALGSTATRQAEIAALEAERMGNLFGGIPVVEATTPFPTDPRRVVAALAPWLPTAS